MLIPIFFWCIEQLGSNLTSDEGLLELDFALVLLLSLLWNSNMSRVGLEGANELELELLNLDWWGIVEGWEVNLLFCRKFLSSPLNEVEDDEGDKGEALDTFDSTNRVVEDRLDRSGLGLRGEGDRSFENKVVDEGRSTLDNLLDGDNSRLDDSEGKEDSSGVVNSFFETEWMLLWVGVEWNDELVLVLLNSDSFGISVGNWAMLVGDSSNANELLGANEASLVLLEDEDELVASDGEDEEEDAEEMSDWDAMLRDLLDSDEEIDLVASISLWMALRIFSFSGLIVKPR